MSRINLLAYKRINKITNIRTYNAKALLATLLVFSVLSLTLCTYLGDTPTVFCQGELFKTILCVYAHK